VTGFALEVARKPGLRDCYELAVEAAKEPVISSGCSDPTTQQAELLPRDQWRRHPYSGQRPRWSGYCVLNGCACECHTNEPLDGTDFQEIA
jgi:hypothetical protein